jgi:hypothetical protein
MGVDPLGLQPPYKPGSFVTVDPKTLQAGRQYLNAEKVNESYKLYRQGQRPPLPVQITQDGVIFNGNSRARAAAQVGTTLDCVVVGERLPGQGLIVERPFFNGTAVWDTPFYRFSDRIQSFFAGLFRGPRTPGSGGAAGGIVTIAVGAEALGEGITKIVPYIRRVRAATNGDLSLENQ